MKNPKTIKNKKILKRIITIFILIIVVVLFALASMYIINKYIDITGNEQIIYYDYAKEVEKCDYGIVPGTTVIDGYPAPMLKNRLDMACRAYMDRKISKIIVSDSEKNALAGMFNYLIDQGIPEKDIYLDSSGEDTYNTVRNSVELSPDSTFYLFTQEQFANRAGYILNSFESNSKVIIADDIIYQVYLKQELREYGAKVKAFFNVLLPFTAGSVNHDLIKGQDYVKSSDYIEVMSNEE